jgi:NifU-like protein involved in Fe-S cluster formation
MLRSELEAALGVGADVLHRLLARLRRRLGSGRLQCLGRPASGKATGQGSVYCLQGLKVYWQGGDRPSLRFLDHAHNPRNRGLLPGFNASGLFFCPLRRETLSLMLRVENGRVAGARYFAAGSLGLVAVASAGSELLRNCTLAQAARLRGAHLREALGGRLPARQWGAVRIFLQCLSQALGRAPKRGVL